MRRSASSESVIGTLLTVAVFMFVFGKSCDACTDHDIARECIKAGKDWNGKQCITPPVTR